MMNPSMTIAQGRAWCVKLAPPGHDVEVAEDALGEAVGPVKRAVTAAEEQLGEQELMKTMAVTQPGLRTSATPTISRNMYGRSCTCSRSAPGITSIIGLMNWSPMMLS